MEFVTVRRGISVLEGYVVDYNSKFDEYCVRVETIDGVKNLWCEPSELTAIKMRWRVANA
jgi:hypothetical protein